MCEICEWGETHGEGLTRMINEYIALIEWTPEDGYEDD